MNKLLILLLLLSTMTFGQVQCKYCGHTPRSINKTLGELQSKGYKIIDIKFIQNNGTTNKCTIVYENNR